MQPAPAIHMPLLPPGERKPGPLCRHGVKVNSIRLAREGETVTCQPCLRMQARLAQMTAKRDAMRAGEVRL